MSATADAHSYLSLVALITWWGLLLRAKHLFVAAIEPRAAAKPRRVLIGG